MSEHSRPTSDEIHTDTAWNLTWQRLTAAAEAAKAAETAAAEATRLATQAIRLHEKTPITTHHTNQPGDGQ